MLTFFFFKLCGGWKRVLWIRHRNNAQIKVSAG